MLYNYKILSFKICVLFICSIYSLRELENTAKDVTEPKTKQLLCNMPWNFGYIHLDLGLLELICRIPGSCFALLSHHPYFGKLQTRSCRDQRISNHSTSATSMTLLHQENHIFKLIMIYIPKICFIALPGSDSSSARVQTKPG